MKAICALIPATLVAGIVLSGPVEGKGTADFSAHARRVVSKQEYFTVMNAKRLGKINRVGSLKARKKAVAAGKATKKVVKTASLKPRKKLAKFTVADKKRGAVSVATSKQHEIKPHKTARLEPASMSKVPRSGPREVKNIMLGEALQGSAASQVRIARLEPASMSKVLRSGPREAKNIMSSEALQVDEASEVRIADLIREMAPSYGVPTWFALRIADVESGYNPYALGRAGEIGVYQLKCQTARGMGFEGACSSLTDARTNVRWGLKHLSLAIASSGGNLRLAASKHNAGLGRKSLVYSYIEKVF